MNNINSDSDLFSYLIREVKSINISSPILTTLQEIAKKFKLKIINYKIDNDKIPGFEKSLDKLNYYTLLKTIGLKTKYENFSKELNEEELKSLSTDYNINFFIYDNENKYWKLIKPKNNDLKKIIFFLFKKNNNYYNLSFLLKEFNFENIFDNINNNHYLIHKKWEELFKLKDIDDNLKYFFERIKNMDIKQSLYELINKLQSNISQIENQIKNEKIKNRLRIEQLENKMRTEESIIRDIAGIKSFFIHYKNYENNEKYLPEIELILKGILKESNINYINKLLKFQNKLIKSIPNGFEPINYLNENISKGFDLEKRRKGINNKGFDLEKRRKLNKRFLYHTNRYKNYRRYNIISKLLQERYKNKSLFKINIEKDILKSKELSTETKKKLEIFLKNVSEKNDLKKNESEKNFFEIDFVYKTIFLNIEILEYLSKQYELCFYIYKPDLKKWILIKNTSSSDYFIFLSDIDENKYIILKSIEKININKNFKKNNNNIYYSINQRIEKKSKNYKREIYKREKNFFKKFLSDLYIKINKFEDEKYNKLNIFLNKIINELSKIDLIDIFILDLINVYDKMLSDEKNINIQILFNLKYISKILQCLRNDKFLIFITKSLFEKEYRNKINQPKYTKAFESYKLLINSTIDLLIENKESIREKEEATFMINFLEKYKID